jgi:hypothetical protein
MLTPELVASLCAQTDTFAFNLLDYCLDVVCNGLGNQARGRQLLDIVKV